MERDFIYNITIKKQIKKMREREGTQFRMAKVKTQTKVGEGEKILTGWKKADNGGVRSERSKRGMCL